MDPPPVCEEIDKLLAGLVQFKGNSLTKYRASPKPQRDANGQEANAEEVNATADVHNDESIPRVAKNSTQPSSSSRTSSNALATDATPITPHNIDGKPVNDERVHQQETTVTAAMDDTEVQNDNNHEQIAGGYNESRSADNHDTNITIPTEPDPAHSEVPKKESNEDAPSCPASSPTANNTQPDTSRHLETEKELGGEHFAAPAGATSSMSGITDIAGSHLAHDSDGSDEVVFRQDEYNMVGPRLRPGKVGTPPVQVTTENSFVPEGQSQREDAVVSDTKTKQSLASKPASPTQQGRERYPTPPASKQAAPFARRGPRNGNQNSPVKQQDTKAEMVKKKLRELQEQENIKFGRKVRGIDNDAPPPTGPLSLARQGPGTDPASPVAQEIARLVASEGKTLPIAQNKSNGSALTRESMKEEGITVNPAYNVVAEGKDSDALLVDWQYRPWQTNGDEHFVRNFRLWLENTMKLGFPVDMTRKSFADGTSHGDGKTGLIEEDFDCKSTFLDLSDPANEHAHETAAGYAYNWTMRLQKEKEDSQKEMKRTIKYTHAAIKDEPEIHPYAPKAQVYLRPVEPKDTPGLVKLYNWYHKHTTHITDMDPITEADMKEHVAECEEQDLPFLVAAQQKPGVCHAMNDESEDLYGFITAFDFGAPRSINRYTAQLEVFVHPANYRRGIGRCLIDKMLEVCDPQYPAKRGYFFDCPSNKRGMYCSGENRPLSRLIFLVHHPADDVDHYTWVKKWLERDFGFEEQGLLKGAGVKQKGILNIGYLVYNTDIDPTTGKPCKSLGHNF